MITELTELDRRVLKKERRFGYVFAILILMAGGLFTLAYSIMSAADRNDLLLLIVNLALIALASIVCIRVNRKVNLDLLENRKELLKRTVIKKTVEKSFEAGSGALYSPILGLLFPKLWGQKMRESNKYFVFTKYYKHEVDKEIYDMLKKDTDFYIHFAMHSATILSFSKDG